MEENYSSNGQVPNSNSKIKRAESDIYCIP